jgi:thiamine-monophosphate kinase
MENKLTELSEIGEFGLIKRLTSDVKTYHKSTIKGIGDDAAVVEVNGKYLVVTTDVLVEGIHFDLTYTPLKHLGYKSVVVNLSDVCAMNAVPTQITVSIACSNHFSVESLEELYAGIKLACEIYKVDLVGGDTSSSRKGLFISVTAIGEVEKDKIAYRNTAKVNDLICVSGDLGGAYMGLQLLEREKAIYKTNPSAKLDFEGFDYILERQLKPEARKDVVRALADLDVVPTSMIDISDGLSSEILHICTNSGVGCKIFEDKIPVDKQTALMAGEFELDATTCALSGGEDYELLFTVDVKEYEKIITLPSVTVIGHISQPGEGVNLIARDGTPVPIIAQGWNSMLPENES